MAAWAVWVPETTLMGLQGILPRGSKSSTWTNSGWWKEREKYPSVPWKESLNWEKSLCREGRLQGRLVSTHWGLLGADLGGSSEALCSACAVPVPFPAAGKRSLGAGAQPGAAGFMFRAVWLNLPCITELQRGERALQVRLLLYAALLHHRL